MSLQLDLTKEQLWYCKLLAKGQVEFEDLDFETQLVVYESNVDLSDTVPYEQLQQFEDKLALKGHFGLPEMVKAAGREGRRRVL